MELTFSEQIKILMRRQGLTIADLAERLGVSRQNVNQQLLKDNFKYADMVKYAAALGYDVKIELTEKRQ